MEGGSGMRFGLGANEIYLINCVSFRVICSTGSTSVQESNCAKISTAYLERPQAGPNG